MPLLRTVITAMFWLISAGMLAAAVYAVVGGDQPFLGLVLFAMSIVSLFIAIYLHRNPAKGGK